MTDDEVTHATRRLSAPERRRLIGALFSGITALDRKGVLSYRTDFGRSFSDAMSVLTWRGDAELKSRFHRAMRERADKVGPRRVREGDAHCWYDTWCFLEEDSAERIAS